MTLSNAHVFLNGLIYSKCNKIMSAALKFRGIRTQFSNQMTRLYSTKGGPLIHVEDNNSLKTITLVDSKTRNSLSDLMLGELINALKIKDSNTRCILLKAQGPAFSAGHNLKHILSSDSQSNEDLFETCFNLMKTIRTCPAPVVASVTGVAAAAGCQLVAACDIVVAAASAKFSTPGINVGLFCSTPGVPLSRCVPRKTAAYMLMTGLPLTAEQALTAGLVSVVVPDQDLEAATEHVINSILNKSGSVLSMGKDFFYKQLEMTEDEAYREGSKLMVKNIKMYDCQEGIRSFIEKRKPVWIHEC